MADSNVVKWFWQAVEAFDEERRARLLQFVTGSTRVPLQGFKALQGDSEGGRISTLVQGKGRRPLAAPCRPGAGRARFHGGRVAPTVGSRPLLVEREVLRVTV